jgi:hypothetical protein
MMATSEQRDRDKDVDKHKRDAFTALIGEQVIHSLGQPGDLVRVQVRPLWGNHYRVNVLTGADAVSVKIAHSYFLQADGEGKIVTSKPGITKTY